MSGPERGCGHYNAGKNRARNRSVFKAFEKGGIVCALINIKRLTPLITPCYVPAIRFANHTPTFYFTRRRS